MNISNMENLLALEVQLNYSFFSYSRHKTWNFGRRKLVDYIDPRAQPILYFNVPETMKSQWTSTLFNLWIIIYPLVFYAKHCIIFCSLSDSAITTSELMPSWRDYIWPKHARIRLPLSRLVTDRYCLFLNA